MGKLGTKNNPIRVRVSEEHRMEEVVRICLENNWQYICGFEPDQPEDISELEYMLNPKSFAGKQPKMKYIEHMPIVRTEPKIGRNDPCPCGSGRKYKKCCLN